MMSGGSTQSMGTGMSGAFNVLDYELSVPLSYSLKKLGFSITPFYALPVNPATISNDQNTTYKEKLSNSFFWTLGLSYKFL